jgi:hypothetical protein
MKPGAFQRKRLSCADLLERLPEGGEIVRRLSRIMIILAVLYLMARLVLQGFAAEQCGNALIMFARGNQPIWALLLLAMGTNISHRDEYGDTPLRHAVFNSGADTVKVLLICDARQDSVNSQGYTPLLCLNGDAIQWHTADAGSPFREALAL